LLNIFDSTLKKIIIELTKVNKFGLIFDPNPFDQTYSYIYIRT